MTQNRETDSGQDEQRAIEPDLTGYTREGVIAWIRANGLECGTEAPTSESRKAAVIGGPCTSSTWRGLQVGNRPEHPRKRRRRDRAAGT